MATHQPAQALASHLVSQTLSSIGLLETLNLITPADAAEIRNRLPNPYTTFPSLAMNTNATASSPVASPAMGAGALVGGMQNMAVSNYQPPAHAPSAPTPAVPALPPRSPAPAFNEQRARALWDYNGSDVDDLRFRQGDTVIIDEEVNKEWFRGRLANQPGEKGGLFPSNYVEKLPPTTTDEKAQPAGMVPYQPPGPAVPYYTPPPGQQQQYAMPPPQQPGGNTVIVQHEDPKKNKFGKLGGNLGNAAVTGAGFGFGSAVASNLVNAIL